MKRFTAILITAAALAGVAQADVASVKVAVPQDLTTAESITTFVRTLDAAVSEVCRREHFAIGERAFAAQACIEQTKAEVAKLDPTGLYAAHIGLKLETRVAQN